MVTKISSDLGFLLVSRRRILVLALAAAVLVLMVGVVPQNVARAANFTVNSTVDAVDADLGDGICDDGSGNCTLRAAIDEANVLPDADTIDVPVGTYTLTLGSGLFLSTDLALNGAGAQTTIIEANVSRGFSTYAVFNSSGSNVSISGVTIRHGNGVGAGITNTGNLTISDRTVSQNDGTSSGGGIGNFNFGTLVVVNSTITDNTVSIQGAGIHNQPTSTLTVINSTISENTASDGGGGIRNSGTATLTNNTITKNSATNRGGGVFGDTGSVTLLNTIIADNTAGIDGPDCFSGLLSQGHNLIGDDTGCAYVPGPGDLVGTGASPINPLLGLLQDNGGPTETYELLTGSPAIEAGDGSVVGAPLFIITDQRGLPRLAGLEVDMGAFELQPAPATVNVPLLTEIAVAATGQAAVNVLDTFVGDLGAYQFEVSFDPTVVQVTDVLGGVAPFDAVTAFNIDNLTGVVRWNHFQTGQVTVPADINVANMVFIAVGLAGQCTTLDITVVDLVDNQGALISSVDQDGQLCLVIDGLAETDLVAAQDVDDPVLAAGVKPILTLIKDTGSGLPLPAVLVASYEANLTFPASLAVATECRLKPTLDGIPNDCTIGAGSVHLLGTGLGETAPIDPLAFVAIRLIGSNNPITGTTVVDLNFVEIKDTFNSVIPQDLPPDSRTFLRGDALADGGVSISDALYIGQYLVDPVFRPVGEGPGQVNPVNAASVSHDVVNDLISLADSVLIAQYLVGSVDEFYNP